MRDSATLLRLTPSLSVRRLVTVWRVAVSLASLFVVAPQVHAQSHFNFVSRAGDTICVELTTASAKVRRPTVVLISGSGPHSREYSTDAGNSEVGNRAFAVIRDSLAAQGFAVVRFDERGTGCSSGSYESATTLSLADDVEDLVAVLTERPEVAQNKIALLGHSEGALIASIVASRTRVISAVVALGGSAWNGRRIMQWQWQRGDGATQPDGRELATTATERAEAEQEHERRIRTDLWYRTFLELEPLAFVPSHVPLLLVHGADDQMVSVEQAYEVARTARERGNGRVSVLILDGHDHALGSSSDLSYVRTFPHKVVSQIVAWFVANQGEP